MQKKTLYYGWVQISALAVTQLICWGVLYYAFSVVLHPMQTTFGWGIAETTGAYSLGLFVNGITVPVVGRLLDEHGPRAMMSIGSAAAALLVFAWSQVTSLAGLYAIWFAIGLVMSLILYEPAFWLAAQWFRRRRGRALTLITFGGGLASTVFIPLTSLLTTTLGWRDALQWLALIIAVVTVPLHLLLRRRPQEHGLLPDGDAQPVETTSEQNAAADESTTLTTAVHTLDFWLLSAAFALSTAAWSGISVHFIAYGHSRGMEPAAVATAAGMIGVTQVIGRTLLGPATDRFSRRTIAIALFTMQATAFLALMLAPGNLGLVLYVICFGVGFGVLTPIRAALVADAYGVRHYGAISGAMSLMSAFTRAAVPVLAGAAIGRWGYTPVLVSCAAAALCGAAALGRVTHLKSPASTTTNL
jgi:MFS family permease